MLSRPDRLTESHLADSGLAPGMRVLDIGCGFGDVSRMATRLVGPEGRVVGIDRSESVVAAARERAAAEGLANIEFRPADLNDLPDDLGFFDALIGRRVLMYQPDAGASLRHLADRLMPGAIVALQEHDMTEMPLCQPDLPLHRRVHGWLMRTVEAEGANIHLGLGLPAALSAAGLEAGLQRVEATVISAGQPHAIGRIVTAMAQRIEAAGAATPEEIQAESLDERLMAELLATGGTCLWELVFLAQARKPA